MSLMQAPCLVAILTAAVVLLLPTRRSLGASGREQLQPDNADDSISPAARRSSNSSEPSASSSRRGLPSPRMRRSSKAALWTRTAPSAEAVASALALLALAFRSGLPTWQVLDAVADQSADDVSHDLRQVAAALRWGAGEQEAWASVDPAWAPAARAVSIAHRAGIAPAALLMKAADDTRRADLERLELAAAQVGVRLVLPLGLVLLPAFCLTTVVPLVVSLGRRLLTSE
ncbi:hypothetical protein BA895_00955 [Humibacillus sp. DSM 29435]|uniref:type II secretion system F family protein n=1 Tax=Humibacillus sp. DSM 29435 TaxID=1869167 RepID=UPI000871E2B1|nr:type II secretion system F family protein [Humibacillus sp. DSM 29435]OFE18789.1 hypothetical protein BA895_00955 [Humibacillus sp. DSM 29435]